MMNSIYRLGYRKGPKGVVGGKYCKYRRYSTMLQFPGSVSYLRYFPQKCINKKVLHVLLILKDASIDSASLIIFKNL